MCAEGVSKSRLRDEIDLFIVPHKAHPQLSDGAVDLIFRIIAVFSMHIRSKTSIRVWLSKEAAKLSFSPQITYISTQGQNCIPLPYAILMYTKHFVIPVTEANSGNFET